MIKTLFQALPTYTKSLFLLPKKICRFWWRHSCNSHGLCWKQWKDLCGPKSEGRMGFWGPRHFNKALLAKQFWRLLWNSNSLQEPIVKLIFYMLRSNIIPVWFGKVWWWDENCCDKVWYIMLGMRNPFQYGIMSGIRGPAEVSHFLIWQLNLVWYGWRNSLIKSVGLSDVIGFASGSRQMSR